VWVTPDLLRGGHEIFKQGDAQVHSLIVLEARPCTGESDLEIVQSAWDFEELNRLYRSHLNILRRRPKRLRLRSASGGVIRSWAEEERKAWCEAIRKDPLLPKPLHPPGYLGPRAYKLRQEALGPAGRAFLGGGQDSGENQGDE
jgi:DNA-binding transcriptional regulator PaaX